MAKTIQSTMMALLGMKELESSHTCFHDSIETTRDEIAEKATKSKAIRDSYSNELLAIGNADKVESFTNYGFSNNTLNWTLWLALYNDSWVFKRAIDKPAADEIRCGITLNGEHDFTEIYTEYKKHQSDFIQLLQWGALFGGAVAVMMFDNFKNEDYKEPIEKMKDKVKACKVMKMYVVDRWYGVSPSSDTVDDMTDLDYTKPKSYQITFGDGNTMTVHHDYIIRYEHRTAPKLVKNGQLQGWGYAEGAHILNELSRDDKLKSSIQSLVDKSLIEVIKMPGMRGVYLGGDQDNNQQMTQRLEMVNWGRTFNSLTFLDKDDEYQQNSFGGLGGLSDILAQNMWLVAAALEMDNTLFGDLKGGLSNDSNASVRYDNTIMGRCDAFVRPCIEKYLKVQFLRFSIEEKIDFEFKSLLVKEQDKDKMEGMKNFQALLSNMLNDGVITLKHYAKAMQLYTAKGVIDFGLTDEDIEKLDDKMAEEMENIDLDNDDDDKLDISKIK